MSQPTTAAAAAAARPLLESEKNSEVKLRKQTINLSLV